MRPLIRSLFLLSLSAAPLALAATPAKAVPAPAEAVSTAAADTAPASGDVTGVRTQVRELEATLNSVRREVAQLQEQEAVIRNRGISEPVDHFNWGQF